MMVSEQAALAEPPVPLALARLQQRAPARGLRAHRPSLPLASLLETGESDEPPRRLSDQPCLREDRLVSDSEVLGRSDSRRRASAALYGERYTQLMEFDSPRGAAGSQPRRASLAVSSPTASDARRRSWAARLQLERKKRRKSGAGEDDDEEASPVGYVRQKRPSWWNLLVPETILKNRSRRASHQLSRSDDSIDIAVRRSKSRSVDHGLAAPLDLEALRCKVEGRIEAVHRDEEEATKRLPAAPPAPPVNTTTYTVRDRDTLTSVAARFDTTPSELTKLNRLATPFIFSGQQLLVPDKRADGGEADAPSDGGDTASESNASAHTAEPAQEKELLDTLRPVSPDAPASTTAPRFLKINVRHITDGQGVVSGVLLVTPNAIMFDPNVSDTLVLEHGPESYGVIAPMEFVCNAAIFYDIAHMRTKDPVHNAQQASKAEIYYMNKTHSPGNHDSLLVKDETSCELECAEGVEAGEGETAVPAGGGGGGGESGSWGEPPERGGAAFPKAFDRELVTPTHLQQQTAEERRRSLLDHHWAIPSKERTSIDNASEVSSGADHREDTSEDPAAPSPAPLSPAPSAPPAQHDPPAVHLVKLSYHDSGIDIREPALNATSNNNNKKVYSDADIVLSAEWVPPVCIAPAEPPLSAPPLGARDELPLPGTRKPASVSFSLDGNAHHKDESKGDKKNKMLKRLSYPLSWMEGLAGEPGQGAGSQADSLPTSADSHNSGSVFSKVFNRRSSLGGFGRSGSKSSTSSAPQPRLDYRSMVSVDDMPELFVSFDKLIPRPARPSDDPPLYLRLRMGRPVGRVLPRTTPLMSYGRKRMKPEYWFGIPRNRVDDLYKFLTHWVPELYGPLGDVAARGYELVDSDTEWDDDDKRQRGERSDSQGDVGDLTRESWEVLSMSDELRRALYSSGASVDMEFSPPDLIGTTEILTMEHREKLCGVLPARAQGYMWSLVFSTSLHGFSLASMYRKMQRVDSPILLVVQDTDNNVFGALTSSPLHPSEHFYGTGESLLFSFQRVSPQEVAAATKSHDTDKLPDDNDETVRESQGGQDEAEEEKSRFRVWQWTGDNMYFIRGSADNISIGAGDGKFGLWLDGDLFQGRTQQCTTYGNEPLTTKEDFVVKIMECWAFI